MNLHHRQPSLAKPAASGLLLLALIAAAGCHNDMHDQPRYEPLEPSSFFANDMSSRPLVAGTVARGELNEDQAFLTGRDENGKLLTEVPLELDRAVLERGRERFNIFCSPCHARTGNGDGMIVQRGFRRPPSFHTERLRETRSGHFFDVITKGFASMPSYAVQIEPRDRWAIVAYIRVLQLSQHAKSDDIPPEELSQIDQPQEPAPEAPVSTPEAMPQSAEEGPR
jgi:mono/diheme cytochrome c family protein